jgi:hypothetical protein
VPDGGAALSGRAALGIAALFTVAMAVALDIVAGEHLAHTTALGAVAVAVAFARIKLAGRYGLVFSLVSGALVAQPALHAVSRLERPAGSPLGSATVQTVADSPVTLTQVVVSALLVLTAASCSQVVTLLVGTFRRCIRRALVHRPAPTDARPHPTRTARHGSTLRWCGWVIRSARRGPPVHAPIPCG